MAHRHSAFREEGPRGCSDNVSYIQICSCGCERRICFCRQCASNFGNFAGWKKGESNKGDWVMPTCNACGLRHPLDQSCVVRQGVN